MDRNICKSFWILFVVLGVTYGFRSFQRRIPNGGRVPHPCGRGQVWGAVGHMESHHVTSKNVFGNMMKDNGLNWGSVCKQDADGDGLTNGEELGDPDCLWTQDRATRLASPTGHPGFCEPERAQCSSGSNYRDCPNRNGRSGPPSRSPHRHHATPPPHAGKHPQALLTERLGNRAGGFGGSGQSRFDNFGAFQSGFGGQQTRVPSLAGGFGQQTRVPSLGGGFGQPQPFNPTPATPNFGPAPFDYPQDRSVSGSFDAQSQSMAGPTGSSFWSGPQAGGMEPSRDSFSRSLNQRFLQGGRQSGFTPFGFQSAFGFQQPQNGGQSLENQVQRRIQNARFADAGTGTGMGMGMGRVPFSGMNWQGSSSGRGGMSMQQFRQPMFGQ